MKKVEIAVIPAAGLGTRFLSASKAIPKEMFPIIDKPTIELIVQEAVESGIKKVVLVVSDKKAAIKDHFTINQQLEDDLIQKEKKDAERANKPYQPKLSSLVNYMVGQVEIVFVTQKEMGGLGDAILTAREVVKDQPFVVLLGDDLVVASPTATKQLIDQYHQTGASILGVQKVAYQETKKYGIIEPMNQGDLMRIKGMVEKPDVALAPSQFAVLGRYLFTSKIFAALDRVKREPGKELQLTSGIVELLQDEAVYAYIFKGKRYDVGDKFGFIQATVEFGLTNSETKTKVEEYLKEIKL